MALSFDGKSIKIAAGTQTASTSITMAHANDLVIAIWRGEKTSTPHCTVTSVSKTAGTATVGSFTKRQTVYLDNVPATASPPNAWCTLEVWSATATVAGTATLTFVISGTADISGIEVFAINFDSVSVPVWTSNGPFTGATSTTSSVPSVSSVSTNAASIVLGLATYPDNQVTQTVGSGYTQVNQDSSGAGTLGLTQFSEDQAFATSQSGLTVACGTAWPNWLMIADAVEAPGAAPSLNFGWYHRETDDRPPPIRRPPDETWGFFLPSPNPVPTTWLPTTGADLERLPPIARAPDEPPGPYFARSPNPVPTSWLPTTGEDIERLPPILRPPDEPPTVFARSPSPVPTRWVPTAGEHDHIKPIARAPDEPPGPYFARSPSPVPTTWLPTTGEEDRPPNPNRIRSPDEPYPFFARSPNPVPTTWLPTTGEDFERPPPITRPPDEPPPMFQAPIAQTVGISGIAWYNPAADKERLPPIGRSSDEPQTFFVRSPSPVPAQWLPTTGQEDRPPPVGPDPSATSFVAPVPVGISGMAWWRSVEVLQGPPLPQMDYALSWNPQVIVRVTFSAISSVKTGSGVKVPIIQRI